MKANVYDENGVIVETVELPPVFETPVRVDLIRRAVIALHTHSLQPKGTKPKAGRDYTAEYIGMRRLPPWRRTINVGRARLPRTKDRGEILFGRVANVPQAVGGPRAHPPKVEKVLREEINKKERRKAIASAIAATANPELVAGRGHVFKEVPLVVVEGVEQISRTKDVKKLLSSLGVWEDVERSYETRRRRAGKGERRGRVHKTRKSVLIVVKDYSPLMKAASNLPGVDVVRARNLNVSLLAPGGVPGRLTIWTKGALEVLEVMPWR